MRRHRGILTIVALLALGALSLGVGMKLYWQDGLPDPEEADGDGLMRWLATRELSEESPEIRQKLLRRLERFLDEQDPGEPFRLSEVLDQLDEDQTERFWSNVYLLAESWFLERVERYDRLGEEERRVFLVGMIDRVKTWGVLNWIPTADARADDDHDDDDFAALAVSVGRHIRPWIDAREDDERKKIEQFLGGVRAYFYWQQFQRSLGG